MDTLSSLSDLKEGRLQPFAFIANVFRGFPFASLELVIISIRYGLFSAQFQQAA